MFARLWWKDVRQFWPIWAILAGAAAGGQWLLLKYGGHDARNGLLLAFATGWALLYGFAVSAAAFAGERENNTLAFLDMIPVGRGVLWRGKASFAVVTTFALAVALIAMAWVYTDRWPPVGPWARAEVGTFTAHLDPRLVDLLVALGVGAVLLEVLGWGLFWSAVSSNAMVAAVMAMVCSAFGLSLFRREWATGPVDLLAAIPWRLGLFLATSAASAVVITRGGRPERSWADLTSHEISAGAARGARSRPVRSPRRILSPQVRALVWQTSREVWPVWWRLLAIGFGLPLVCLVIGFGADSGVVVMLNDLLALVAAVGVFGAENRNKTQRFLAHNGARPGVVWAVKVAVWGAWFAPVWLALTVFTAVSHMTLRQQGYESPVGFLFMITGVAVGLLCGMTIRRGITAGLVAGIAVFAVGLPQVALLSSQMLPEVIPLLVPLVLILVSWAWSGDWMLERPGPGRWVRLGLMLIGAFLFVFAVHVGVRVWGVPDVGPGFDVAAFERAALVDKSENAAELYREAVRRNEIVGSRVVVETGQIEPLVSEARAARREERKQILELIRRASAMPRCQFVRLDRVTKLDPYDSRDLSPAGNLDYLVADSVTARRASGDLAGAWDDLMVLFRMARHLSGPVPIGVTYMGLNTERRALSLAMEWSADPRQTPDRVRAALDAYRELPPMPSLIETVRAESILVENTLSLPTEDIIQAAHETPSRASNDYEKSAVAFHFAALTTPWEIARARRSFWVLFGAIGQYSATPPTGRAVGNYLGWNDYVAGTGPSARRFYSYELSRLEDSTPLARWFLPARGALADSNDRNEVARRALVQILALRHWQLTHAGKLPGSLDAVLSSAGLAAPLSDPYTFGSPFQYVRSKGQALLPLGRLDPYWPLNDRQDLRPTTGQWLLYSVGPDRKDDGAAQDVNGHNGLGDIVFPLPRGD